MESWRHALEEKSPFLCDEKVSVGWNMKPSCNFDSMLGSNREAIEGMEFVEMGFPDMMRKLDPINSCLDALNGEIGDYFSRTLHSPAYRNTSNSSFGELDPGLSLSGPVIVSNTQKSSLIDLKLGRLGDWKEAKNSIFSNERSVLSSSGSSLKSKRARLENLSSQNPVCQVHGCNKDLSSSKSYHKRHKVCDIHSKTARVIVNSIEQRFCQQCSSFGFHLLAEFDDGKRSCRKRLAGHNERRRKPQLDFVSGKPHKLLRYYDGARFLRTPLPKRSSFVFPDMLPGGYFSSEGNAQGNQSDHIKVESEPIYSPQLSMLTTNRQSHSKPVFHLHSMGKQNASEKISSQLGYTFLETELSGISNSSIALSLLSAQTKNLSSHLTGIPMLSPLITQGTNAHCGINPNSEDFVVSPNGFHSSGMNSMELDRQGPSVIFDAGIDIDFEVEAGGIFQRSDSVKSKSCLSHEHGHVDLIQLASHFQRVEQQRNSMQVKQENSVFCSFPTM
ncbi:unnamed protein product [Camellia sinensis]